MAHREVSSSCFASPRSKSYGSIGSSVLGRRYAVQDEKGDKAGLPGWRATLLRGVSVTVGIIIIFGLSVFVSHLIPVADHSKRGESPEVIQDVLEANLEVCALVSLEDCPELPVTSFMH